MVKKLQTYITIVGKPYEPNPSDYPGCNTLEEQPMRYLLGSVRIL